VKLVVGLGNPGDKYAGTRHNIGFLVAERLAEKNRLGLKKKGFQALYGVGRLATQEAVVLLPQTFMNCSGASVNAAVTSYRVAAEDLIVIYDDIDLPFGRMRIKSEGGHGGHNGIRDIISVLGFRNFIRVRVGIGRPEHGDVTSHVLGRFSSAEQKNLSQLLDAVNDAVSLVLNEGVTTAMNTFNSFCLDE
jgi:PTH1 family peptidyl-tRNA hydrolase